MLIRERQTDKRGWLLRVRPWVLILFSICFTAVLTVSGCATSSTHTTESSAGEIALQHAVEPAAATRSPAYDYATNVVLEEAEYSGASGAAHAGDGAGEMGMERKIIREQHLTQQVQDLAEVIASLEAALAQLPGAYVESLREWKNEEREQTVHRAEMVLRIPLTHFPDFLIHVEQQGNIIERHVSGQDVTEEYIDNEARLRNLTRHEERILQLYERAETIEEMLQIEQELSRIRSSIEQIEGRQKYLNLVTSTAKLTLQLFQVEELDYLTKQKDTSILKEAGLGFLKSIQRLLHVSERAFIILISLLPFLLTLLLLMIFGYLILRAVLTRRKRKNGNDPSQEEERTE